MSKLLESYVCSSSSALRHHTVRYVRSDTDGQVLWMRGCLETPQRSQTAGSKPDPASAVVSL
ncbi:MAG: hypothetical protein ACKOAH_10515, partial [Pirellula sp.]